MRISPEGLKPSDRPKCNPNLPPDKDDIAMAKSLALGFSVFGGMVLGGQFLSVGIASELLKYAQIPDVPKAVFSQLAIIPGGIIFGGIIPAEIYRRSHCLSLPDFWNKICPK